MHEGGVLDAYAHAADDEGRRRADAIGNHHWHAGESKLERHRPGFGHSSVARGTGIVAFGDVCENHLERPVLCHAPHHLGSRWHDRNYGVQIGVGLSEQKKRFAEYWEHATHLTGSAARNYAKKRRVLRQAVARSETFAVAALHARFDRGVADIGASNAVFGEEGDLERQQRHDVIEPLRELTRAPGAPSPKLRRHVVNDGDARPT